MNIEYRKYEGVISGFGWENSRWEETESCRRHKERTDGLDADDIYIYTLTYGCEEGGSQDKPELKSH